jgi:hypothetical protein
VSQLRFRNFGNLSFLQSVDKPRFLSRLLAEHSAYFVRHGIDVGALTNDDACARRLLEVFTQPDDAMPGALLHTLHLLDALADEAGHERILEEAKRCGVDLSAMPDDLCPGDFALAVWFEQPRLVRVCREKTVCQSFKRYYEFRSRDQQRLDLAAVKVKTGGLQEILGPWFDSRQRTSTCEVFVYKEGTEVRCLVTHGALYRTDGSITAQLERSRIGYRPQRHDSILYDTCSGILKIHAQFAAERNAYREALGQVLFNDPAYFPEKPAYTLECLRTNGGVLTMVAGMRSVRLTEVWIERGTEKCRQQILKGDDLTEMVAGCGPLDVARGTIVRASFSIEYASGGRARRLEVCLPNVADHDRDRDGPLVEAYLRANHFEATEPDGDGSAPLVAAA